MEVLVVNERERPCEQSVKTAANQRRRRWHRELFAFGEAYMGGCEDGLIYTAAIIALGSLIAWR